MTLDLLTKAVIVALCALVILGSICRLDMMHARTNRGEWIALYTAAATFAAGMVLDLAAGRAIDWHEVAGVVALLLQLHCTRRLWIDGPPPNTRKGTP
jgi:hypothetical protein